MLEKNLLGRVSVSLGADHPPPPSLANHNPAISSVPQALKILTSPSRQTKSPDNSNALNVFINNDTYTNFKSLQTHANSPMVPCSRIIWITNYSYHRRVWTANFLHMKQLPNPLQWCNFLSTFPIRRVKKIFWDF